MLSIVLSMWGAGLATLLAGLRFWEFWRDSQQLYVSYHFTSDAEDGNKIILINNSRTPVIISYWELYWLKWRGWFRKREETDSRFPDDPSHITIGAHTHSTLIFEAGRWFEWGPGTADKGDIYIRLHIVGRRRPKWLRVYKYDW